MNWNLKEKNVLRSDKTKWVKMLFLANQLKLLCKHLIIQTLKAFFISLHVLSCNFDNLNNLVKKQIFSIILIFRNAEKNGL